MGGGTGSATGGEGNDIIYQIEGVEGSDFNDTLIGGDGSDHIQGGAGSDSINGGLGADFIVGGQGSDTIDGGAGYDMISYHNFDYQNPSRTSSVGVVVNLLTGNATDNWENTDTLSNIEAVEGSDLNDTLIGGDGSDHIQGGEGSDFISGGADVDTLTGDQGNDTFAFNLGSQTGSTVTDVITDFVRTKDKIGFDIPSTEIQFESNIGVDSLGILLDAFDTIVKTEGKILFYFGVIDRDGYLVTENEVGLIGNIIQFSGVTNLDPTDIVEL
jgi:Ca2+-binding RTX toxin-like protein